MLENTSNIVCRIFAVNVQSLEWIKNHESKLYKFLIAAIGITAVAIALKSLREPDIFWMLRTGEWMVSNFEVIKHDHFSFSMQGNDWVNVKWLFEVIIYFISLIGGAEFVPVLQAAVNLLLLTVWGVVLKKIYAANFSHLAFVCSAFMLLLVMDYRMTGRPEMISHLFSAFFCRIAITLQKKQNTQSTCGS